MDFDLWSCCSCAPGTVTHPEQLGLITTGWIDAHVPGTVASTLAIANRWDMHQPPIIDDLDWWYRTRFSNTEREGPGRRSWLCFDGLATLAEIWLNGQRLLTTNNMFRTYRIDVSDALVAENELAIVFRSMTEELKKKRSRPRWKTRLVNQQQLRWQRTALVGHIPGWSPPVPAIGPWRAVRLEQSTRTLTDVHVVTRLDGTTGIVTIDARLHSSSPVDRVWLRVGDHKCVVNLHQENDGIMIRGELRLPDAPQWWPHTHGSATLLPCEILIESGSDRDPFAVGQIGFRHLRVDRTNGFSIELNGQPIFCRGACWTTADLFTLDGTEETLRHDFTLARDAGVNMLRVNGTIGYESDLFYQLCDEFGILVWQDFPFANMDYPTDDSAFADNITAEAVGQLQRLSRHPCIAVYCGNSEVEQQAAMLGMPRELWSNDWFAQTLPRLCAESHPGTEYVPSTPTGGVLPFHSRSGISHYYGVGAYLRSPAELRQANLKFASECLGFANVPEPEMVDTIMGGALPAAHHPKWKQRVPRDTGAGWDFEDVRDHYLKQIYGLDPVLLRSTDMPRYLELSRLVSGEMMAQAFSEWRSSHSHNRGGLVWFFKDLWPATGWGIIDSSGTPKAAYYFLKRIWQNRQILLTDEGLNGLDAHVINECVEPLSGFVEVTLLKEPNVIIARHETSLDLKGRGQTVLSADELLGSFYDVSYAYRFGPPHHDIVVATLLDADRNVLSEAFHFVRRRESIVAHASIEVVAEMINALEYRVTMQSDRFLHGVRLRAKGFRPEDNYFHLAPQRKKIVRCIATSQSPAEFHAEMEAINLENTVTISVVENRE